MTIRLMHRGAICGIVSIALLSGCAAKEESKPVVQAETESAKVEAVEDAMDNAKEKYQAEDKQASKAIAEEEGVATETPAATPEADDTPAKVAEAKPADAKEDNFKAIAEEAFIYGLPMIMNYAVMNEYFIDTSSSQYKCPFNQIFNTAQVYTPADTAVVTPNSDTPYSFFCADLRVEPVIVTVPEIEKERYYSVQLVDMYTFNYGYMGSRATGNGAGKFMIAGPNFTGETPAGIEKVFRCETEFSFGIMRTQLFNDADMENVKKVQAGYKLESLSAFLNESAPAAAPAIEWPKIDKKLAETDPFAYLSFLLQFCPAVGPAEGETPLRAKFAQIGIEAGKPFPAIELSDEQKAELMAGVKTGAEKIEQHVHEIGHTINGWAVGSAFGDREFYKGDWLLRASAAKAGIYGNDAVEATYPMARSDNEGNPLDGSKHNYTLTFAGDALPPVNAFWSVTMYDGKTQLLIENPIHRYLINSPMLPELKKNADGSLTLYIQKDSPGEEKQSNWLPAPDGPIYLVMRLYWPKEEAPSILPPGEGTWSPPAVKVAE